MDSPTESKIELLERQFTFWEKGLYACYAIAFTMLTHAVIKAHENMVLTDMLFSMERKLRTTAPLVSSQYNADIWYIMGSPWRSLLWIFVELAILIFATTLAFHPAWRKFPLAKRLDLIFGYFFSAWIVLLSLGVQQPSDVQNGINVLAIASLLVLGLAYWWFRGKQYRAEEVFP